MKKIYKYDREGNVKFIYEKMLNLYMKFFLYIWQGGEC